MDRFLLHSTGWLITGAYLLLLLLVVLIVVAGVIFLIQSAMASAEEPEIIVTSSDSLTETIALRALRQHIIAMHDDAYLCEHPEWIEIVAEARRAQVCANQTQ